MHPLLAYPENNETITGLVFYGRMHYLGFWAGVACYYYFGLVTATQKQDHKQVGLLLFLFYIKMSRDKKHLARKGSHGRLGPFLRNPNQGKETNKKNLVILFRTEQGRR